MTRETVRFYLYTKVNITGHRHKKQTRLTSLITVMNYDIIYFINPYQVWPTYVMTCIFYLSK